MKFEKFKVLEINYKNSLSTKKDEEMISPEFNVVIGINRKNKKQGIVRLSVTIGEEDTDNNEYLRVEIVGFFRLDIEDEMEDEEIYNTFRINGTAILFPYLRSIVTDVTGKGDQLPIMLPAININSLFEEMNKVEESNEDKEST